METYGSGWSRVLRREEWSDCSLNLKKKCVRRIKSELSCLWNDICQNFVYTHYPHPTHFVAHGSRCKLSTINMVRLNERTHYRPIHQRWQFTLNEVTIGILSSIHTADVSRIATYIEDWTPNTAVHMARTIDRSNGRIKNLAFAAFTAIYNINMTNALRNLFHRFVLIHFHFYKFYF